ncbi:MAG: hypothetical protein R2867_10400 [Caldilineaceae bacterium]
MSSFNNGVNVTANAGDDVDPVSASGNMMRIPEQCNNVHPLQPIELMRKPMARDDGDYAVMSGIAKRP